ncbi:MAG: hypothetical protein Q8Q69_05965, partial [Nitrosopumilaceae archaeon]|nr:hypothetical protein [Nitrosopumilaceae archaeon]
VGKHKIKNFGDPLLCNGATFNVLKKYKRKFLYPSMSVGKVVATVKDRETGVTYIKFYDYGVHGEILPNESEYLYADAKYLLSNNPNTNGISWTKKSTSDKPMTQRKKRQCWDYEIVTEESGLDDGYDEEVENNSIDEDDTSEFSDEVSCILDDEVLSGDKVQTFAANEMPGYHWDICSSGDE